MIITNIRLILVIIHPVSKAFSEAASICPNFQVFIQPITVHSNSTELLSLEKHAQRFVGEKLLGIPFGRFMPWDGNGGACRGFAPGPPPEDVVLVVHLVTLTGLALVGLGLISNKLHFFWIFRQILSWDVDVGLRSNATSWRRWLGIPVVGRDEL